MAAVAFMALWIFASGSGAAIAKEIVVVEKVENGNSTTMTTRLLDARLESIYSVRHPMSTLWIGFSLPEKTDEGLRIPIEISYEAFPHIIRVTDDSFSVRDGDGNEYPVANDFEWTRVDYAAGESERQEYELIVPDAPAEGSLVFNDVGSGNYKDRAPGASICYTAGEKFHPDYKSCFGKKNDTEKPFLPEKCAMASMKLGLGLSGSLVVTPGREFVLMREEFSDGSASLTILSKESLSGELGVGPELKGGIGKMFDASAKISIGAGVTVSNGSTWLFDKPTEAENLQRSIERAASLEYSGNMSPFGGLMAELPIEHLDVIRKPDIIRSGRELSASGNIDVSVGLQDPNAPEQPADGGTQEGGGDAKEFKPWITNRVAAQGAVKIDNGVAVVINSKDKTVSDVYTLGGTVKVGLDGIEGAPSSEGEQTGSITVTRNKGGTVEEIVLSHARKVEVGIQETVTTLKVENAAELSTVQEWLKASSRLGALPLVWGDMAVTKAAEEMNAFDEILHRKGVTLRTTHAVEKTEMKLSIEIKVLVAIGLAGYISGTSKTLQKAEYLQSPLPFGGERQFGNYYGCH